MAKRRGNRKEVDLDAMVLTGPSGAYEALQLYRSKAIRFKTKNDLMGAVKATAGGATCLLKNGYENAGAELSTLFLELLSEDNKTLDVEIMELIKQIDESYPKKSTFRVDFLKGCVKCSVQTSTREFGDAAIQAQLAETLWENGDYSNAAHHYATGEAPLLYCNKLLALYGTEDKKTEREQAVTMGIVQFLSLENLRDANELFYQYKKESKEKNLSLKSDLINFCDCLLQVSRRDAAPLFKQLVNSYASQLDFHESVPRLLMGPIATRLFGIKPKVNPMMSMLQNMFS